MADERSLKDLAESLKSINDGGSVKEIEAHTRNSRRHLLESKNTLFAINHTVSQLVSFTTSEENQREQKAFNEDLLKALQASNVPGKKTSSSDDSNSSGDSWGASLGTFVSSLGNLPGQMIGGVLSGVATGLKSFANPMVVAGAAGLGLAITAIGTGIAGATWIMSKTLPALTEGLAHLETLDGDTLAKVGNGVYELGKGLAVFGVGGAAAGFGSLALNVSEGLTNFFGGKTPFERVEDFGKLDFNTAKIKNNSEAVVAYSTAMAALGAGSLGAAVGSFANMAGNIYDGIASFFGKGDLPLDKIMTFASYDLPTEKIKNNSEAVGAYAVAMGKLAAGSAGGFASSLLNLGSNLSDGLSSFFGKGELPLDGIMTFASYDLPTEKIKQNSEAVGAYAVAMSKLAGAGLATTGSSLFNLASNVLDGLAFFEGPGDLPLDRMMKFASYDLPGEKIKNNSEAIGHYAIAMMKLAGAQGAGALGSIGNTVSNLLDGIVGLLGGETGLPIDEMNEFANAQINIDGIERNSQALTLFANAISGLGAFKALDDVKDIFNARLVNTLNQASRLDFSKMDMGNLKDHLPILAEASEVLLKFASIEADKINEVANEINKLSIQLKRLPTDVKINIKTAGLDLNTMSVDNINSRNSGATQTSQPIISAPVMNAANNSSTVTNVVQSPSSRTSMLMGSYSYAR
jgi:hypothetical protein